MAKVDLDGSLDRLDALALDKPEEEEAKRARQALLDSEGRVIQLFGLNVDIDESTKVTEALRHTQEKLMRTVGVPAAQTFPTIFRETEIAPGIDTKRCD